MPSTLPGLWIVATPLGNPEDLSPRARECLESADLVLAEDTRRASWLFRQLGIYAKRLESFHDHNEQDRLAKVLTELEGGAKIALISDAGTPLLADPGYRLVRTCRERAVPVHPLPGPSAPIAAISAAGLPPIPFSFLGFLPRDRADQEKIFHAFRNVQGSIIFFERKDRLKNSLNTALAVLGERETAICRELTKSHEEFIIGHLSELSVNLPDLLGEITVIIGPAIHQDKISREEVERLLKAELFSGLKIRQAVANISRDCPGWSSAELYELATALRAS